MAIDCQNQDQLIRLLKAIGADTYRHCQVGNASCLSESNPEPWGYQLRQRGATPAPYLNSEGTFYEMNQPMYQLTINILTSFPSATRFLFSDCFFTSVE